jgi:large subunit ribosomal protein L6
MSRIGRLPVHLPKGVTVKVSDGLVEVSGSEGKKLTLTVDSRISVEVQEKENTVVVKRQSDSKRDRTLHGTYRSLIANMVEGVTKGYEKVLLIQGVGYRAKVEGKDLDLAIGKSHPIRFPIPEGIQMAVEKGTTISIKGCDKQKVGEVAAEIRALYPPEPYLGKGIRYSDEHVRRKAGKTVG